MTRITGALIAFSLFAGCTRVLPKQFEWDPDIRHGTLSNNITYAIRQEQGPIKISILIGAGSLHEKIPGTLWALRSYWEKNGGVQLDTEDIEWQITTRYHHTRIDMSLHHETSLKTALQIINHWLFSSTFEDPLFLCEAIFPPYAKSIKFFVQSFTPLVLLGAKHAQHSPYGTTVNENLSADDVKTFYRDNFYGANIYLSISGQLEVAAGYPLLQKIFHSSTPFRNASLLSRIPFQKTSYYQIVPPEKDRKIVIYSKFSLPQLGPSMEEVARELHYHLFLNMMKHYLYTPEIAKNWADIELELFYPDASLALLRITLLPHDSVMSAIQSFDAALHELTDSGFSLIVLAKEKHAIARIPRDMVTELMNGYPITTPKRSYQTALQALSTISEPELRNMVLPIVKGNRSIVLMTEEELRREDRQQLGEELMADERDY